MSGRGRRRSETVDMSEQMAHRHQRVSIGPRDVIGGPRGRKGQRRGLEPGEGRGRGVGSGGKAEVRNVTVDDPARRGRRW
eukprot:CAMPEP_0183303846 /NCGR_PEP_ID=MMETSP0160_2-20130417/9142_1 /TAXON_ID=2839 ORGANISM="Odontella Sinensis, Strain Grunow 1884" /NCGR_SAMPLE_ID=MMETSP0160_2 /ASSEMBLY_ACC=CAM_ASM_000250 /LENGTH=79 /DNA_ID=CAMNT_0025466809 /DNA_START=600 /DNA_END=836 /DNA_ORIENTATION=+